MRMLIVALMLSPLAALAQAPTVDPLTVTLPNGKTVHFQTTEQKARFEAALAHRATPSERATELSAKRQAFESPLDPPKTVVTQKDPLHSSGPSVGIGNTTAPMFTADYYLPAADTWIDKKLTLAVATLSVSERTRSDGYTQLSAYTYNQGTAGGFIELLAPPEVALKIATLCGGSLQWNMGGVKTTIIHGVMQKEKGEDGRYYVLIEKQ